MEKFVLSEMKDKNFSKAVNEIYLLTDYNKKQYPEYFKWFYKTNVPRVFDGSGEMIFYLDGLEVAGLTILKKTIEEAKICTFMINEDYRKKGYSKILLEDAFSYLGTDKPIITVPTNRLKEFQSIIDSYNWEEVKRHNEYFTEEVVFNRALKRSE